MWRVGLWREGRGLGFEHLWVSDILGMGKRREGKRRGEERREVGHKLRKGRVGKEMTGEEKRKGGLRSKEHREDVMI